MAPESAEAAGKRMRTDDRFFSNDYSKSIPQRLAYSTAEAAALLSISTKTIFRLERRGLLKSSRALRTKLWPRSEVERFIRETTEPQKWQGQPRDMVVSE